MVVARRRRNRVGIGTSKVLPTRRESISRGRQRQNAIGGAERCPWEGFGAARCGGRSAPERLAEIELARIGKGAGAGADGGADEYPRADADAAEGEADGAARAAADDGTRPGAVAGADDADRLRPGYRESGVVAAEARFRLGRVERRDLVEHLGVVDEALEAVGEALGHIERAPVLGIEAEAFPASVGRRARADVDDHVENGAAHAADDLGLGVRRLLVVEAAQRAGAAVIGQAFLDDGGGDAMRLELARTPDAREEATLVLLRLELDEPRIGKPRRRDDHVAALLPRGNPW